jgi:hypothetical protein
MTPRQIELARHALGLPTVSRWSYRNYFTAGPEHSDFGDWQAMVAAGDARTHGPRKMLGGDFAFYLTRAGAEKALSAGERLDPEDFPEASQ